MNKDIRLSVEFWDNPKTVKLERRLGLPAIKSLQVLWLWAAQNKPDGLLSGMDTEDIEIAARWDGDAGSFVDCLLSLRWVDTVDEILKLHGWEEHNSWVSGSDERGDKARLSILFKKNPTKAKELRDSGVTGITKEDYLLYSVVQSNNGRTTVDNDSFTPSPSPSPSPSPKTKEEKPPLPPQGGKPRSFKNWTVEEFRQEINKSNAGILTQEEAEEFFAYWTEPNGSGRPRYSLEKTWETVRRMKNAVAMVYSKRRVEGRAPPGNGAVIRANTVHQAQVLENDTMARNLLRKKYGTPDQGNSGRPDSEIAHTLQISDQHGGATSRADG
ncbi:MAG: hypothetical protein OEV64_09215 [Desulfobulbaceae bacterium]|nr:hypothetical protein [Desulfobulbaceae bacterium]